MLFCLCFCSPDKYTTRVRPKDVCFCYTFTRCIICRQMCKSILLQGHNLAQLMALLLQSNHTILSLPQDTLLFPSVHARGVGLQITRLRYTVLMATHSLAGTADPLKCRRRHRHSSATYIIYNNIIKWRNATARLLFYTNSLLKHNKHNYRVLLVPCAHSLDHHSRLLLLPLLSHYSSFSLMTMGDVVWPCGLCWE